MHFGAGAAGASRSLLFDGPPSRFSSFSVLLFALLLGNGCDRAAAPDPDTSPSSPSAASPGSDAGLPPATMLVMLNHVEGETEFVHTFRDPDAALIEEQVRSLDWDDPQLQPAVSMVLSDEENPLAGRGTFAVWGNPLTAKWMHGEGLKEARLESIDVALDMLIRFRHDDESWHELVEWTEQTGEE